MLKFDCSPAMRRCLGTGALRLSLLPVALTLPLWLGCGASSDDEVAGPDATDGVAAAGMGGGGAAAGSATSGAGQAASSVAGAVMGVAGAQASGGAAGASVAPATGGGGGDGPIGQAASGTGDDAGEGGFAASETTAGAGAGGAGSATSGAAGADPAGGSSGAEGTGSPGCNSANALASGTFMMDVEGASRRYVLDVPSGYDPSHVYPLIFVWHPLGGSADQVVQGGYDGLKSRADDTAILVAPDGLSGTAAGINGQGWYNDGGGDMGFLALMLEHFAQTLCVDESRIFSTGFSYGGMMSYALGYEFGDVFRAIAPSSGQLQGTPHQELTTNALAIMALHGDADDFVGTESGRAARDAYVARNKCQSQTQPVEPSPCVQYQGCEVPTIWCEFPGEHRPWSEAPQAIWDFFSQF